MDISGDRKCFDESCYKGNSVWQCVCGQLLQPCILLVVIFLLKSVLCVWKELSVNTGSGSACPRHFTLSFYGGGTWPARVQQEGRPGNIGSSRLYFNDLSLHPNAILKGFYTT